MEASRSVEDVHALRLMALLYDLERERGRKGAARVLDVDHRTLAVALDEGLLSRRMRVALERALLSGDGSAAVGQRKRIEALERRVEELEREVRGGLKAVGGEVRALRGEHAPGDAAAGAAAGSGGGPPRRSGRGGGARGGGRGSRRCGPRGGRTATW